MSYLWLKRVQELTPVVTEMLRVRSVWCDTKTELNSQKFVIWAGYVLEKRWGHTVYCSHFTLLDLYIYVEIQVELSS